MTGLVQKWKDNHVYVPSVARAFAKKKGFQWKTNCPSVTKCRSADYIMNETVSAGDTAIIVYTPVPFRVLQENVQFLGFILCKLKTEVSRSSRRSSNSEGGFLTYQEWGILSDFDNQIVSPPASYCITDSLSHTSGRSQVNNFELVQGIGLGGSK